VEESSLRVSSESEVSEGDIDNINRPPRAHRTDRYLGQVAGEVVDVMHVP